jgi:hypothetical protein
MILKVNSDYFVRFQVLTAVSMKMVGFWDVAPCSLVEVYRRFKVLAASIISVVIALTMEEAGTSETSANFYQTIRRNIPEHKSSFTIISPNIINRLFM